MTPLEALQTVIPEIEKKPVKEADRISKDRVVELLGKGSDARLLRQESNWYELFLFTPGPEEGLHNSLIHGKVKLKK